VETVVKPGGLHLGSHAERLVGGVHRHEAVHLGGDLLRRSVLVDRPVGSDGVVRLPLEGAPHEGNLNEPVLGSPCRGRLLITRECLIELLDVGGRQLPVLPDEREEPLGDVELIADDRRDPLRIAPHRRVRDERGVDPLLHEKPGDPPIQRVQALDEPRLNGPPALLARDKLSKRTRVLELPGALPPQLAEAPQLLARKTLVVGRKIGDRVPSHP
jgi:hypothetical protein